MSTDGKNNNKEVNNCATPTSRSLTTQLMPNLCPANSATMALSWTSQTRTEGRWPHSPVTRWRPSSEKPRHVMVLRDEFVMCDCRFLRGLYSTTVHLQRRAWGWFAGFFKSCNGRRPQKMLEDHGNFARARVRTRIANVFKTVSDPRRR